LIQKIRVLIVDDSAFMRKSLSILLESDPDIEIAGFARDGLEGYELAKILRPNIITLDIEMPRMDGLTALKKIMEDCPTSVLMISSLTTEGADATLKALELGAVDFIPKEMSFVSVNIVKIKEDLLRKVKTIARRRVFRPFSFQKTVEPQKKETAKLIEGNLPRIPYRALALGISTGGPLSLQKVIPQFSENIKFPIFLVQHMPPKFTKSLAERLNGLSRLKVKEAEDGEKVNGGTVYLAPGGFHMKLKKTGVDVIIKITEDPAGTLHRPSVDVMMDSVVDVYGKFTLGLIMTGMGKDGLEGIRKLKQVGGFCIAQNEESCVVYGMPKAIVDYNFADVVAPLEEIANIINKVV